jgi:hypothetical protein
MSLFQTVGLPWNLALALAAVVGACALILDANWMAAMVRGGPQAARPPLFRSPLPLPRGWRRMAWLAGFVFGLAPLMMLGVTGVRYMSGPSVQVGLLIALVVTLVVLIWSSASGRTRTANVAGVVMAGLILSPYALAGPRGWRLYAVVTGLSILIIGLLFLSVMVHRFLFAWRPGTRVGASVRLVLDAAGALALMAAVFWPAFLHD